MNDFNYIIAVDGIEVAYTMTIVEAKKLALRLVGTVEIITAGSNRVIFKQDVL